jgi:cyclopropane fatty-acyl-phospholipid synthase-like methyltransferase
MDGFEQPDSPATGTVGIYGHYTETPPWDTGRPQPALRALADTGALHGRVLELGCGTGEQTLIPAALGLPTTGIDPSTTAIETARRKARQRGLHATFLVGNALNLTDTLTHPDQQFDTLIDCGLFHLFNDTERTHYATNLTTVTPPGARLFLLCFSDRQPPGKGPRRITQHEIRTTFTNHWHTDTIEPATLDNTKYPNGAKAWLATITRT